MKEEGASVVSQGEENSGKYALIPDDAGESEPTVCFQKQATCSGP